MGRHHATDDDYEDDPEDPDESDTDLSDDDPETIECPHCGKDVYEFADQCPKCGHYLTREETPRKTNHRTWVILTAIAILALMAYGLLRLGI
jgi:predicted RNA-binding Zn-ribbon protein involved in translation (DUF1610 family)